MPEARLEGRRRADRRLVRRQRARLRTQARFGGDGEAHFDDLGIGLYWLEPGQAMAMYHHTLVGTGDESALVVAVGARVAAVRPNETSDEAYARFGRYDRVTPPPVF